MKSVLTADGTMLWYCPGCECDHGVPVIGGRVWAWNKSTNCPTLSTSILVYAHDISPPFKPQPRCHCFMKEGQLQFLDDCGHKLAGKTVPMVDYDSVTEAEHLR